MSFYDPENFTDPAVMAYEKEHRILQPIWDLIRDGHEDALRSPLFPPILAVVFYLSATIPITAFDMCFGHLPFFQRYKFQKGHRVTWPMVRNTLVNAFWNHLLFIAPMSFVQLIWVPPTPLPPVAPKLSHFILHQIVFFFLFDAEYWAWHALHHKVRFLYRWCHAIHHQYHVPFALATQYLHPWELFWVGLGISITPWFFAPHCMTYWSWFIIANWVSIEVHCGFNMPWAAHHWLPLYGGAPAHDLHHARPLTNFEPWLTHLDKMMGWKLTYEELENMKEKRRESIGTYEDKSIEVGMKNWN